MLYSTMWKITDVQWKHIFQHSVAGNLENIMTILIDCALGRRQIYCAKQRFTYCFTDKIIIIRAYLNVNGSCTPINNPENTIIE